MHNNNSLSIWSISFRRGGTSVCFTTNMYNGLNLPPKDFKYHTLFDLVMDYLKGDFTPTKEYYEIDNR